MTRTFRQISPNFHKWETPGETFEGVFKGTEVTDTEMGELTIGTLIEDNGTPHRFNMGMGLKRDFANVEEGAYVRLTFVEKTTTSKGQPFNVIVMEVAEEAAEKKAKKS